MSRGAMTHRAVITRNTAATTDAWNRPDPPTFTALGTVACRAWVKTKKEVRDDGKEIVISDHRAIFPRDADIQTGDRISITDRRGAVIFDGPMAVATISGHGANLRHKEVVFTSHIA